MLCGGFKGKVVKDNTPDPDIKLTNKLTIQFKDGGHHSVWYTFSGPKKDWKPEAVEKLKKHYEPFFEWFKTPAAGDIWVFEIDGGKWAIKRENIVDAISTVREEVVEDED